MYLSCKISCIKPAGMEPMAFSISLRITSVSINWAYSFCWRSCIMGNGFFDFAISAAPGYHNRGKGFCGCRCSVHFIKNLFSYPCFRSAAVLITPKPFLLSFVLGLHLLIPPFAVVQLFLSIEAIHKPRPFSICTIHKDQ